MSADNKKLVKEITGLLAQIDTEGLLFLKQQAGVLIHNQATKELYESRALDNIGKKVPAKKGATAKGAAAKGAAKAPAKKRPVGISVEQSGKNFILVTEKSRSLFGLDEVKALVKICQQSDSKTAGAAMYLWMRKERGDFLANAGIAAPLDPRLVQLADYFKANFSTGR